MTARTRSARSACFSACARISGSYCSRTDMSASGVVARMFVASGTAYVIAPSFNLRSERTSVPLTSRHAYIWARAESGVSRAVTKASASADLISVELRPKIVKLVRASYRRRAAAPLADQLTRQGETPGHVFIWSRTHFVSCSEWQARQGFGIWYSSVISGVMKLNV